MFLASIAFYFIFSHKPYIDPAAARIPCLDPIINMMDVRDIYGDVRENFVDPIPVPRLPRSLPRRWYRDRGGGEVNEGVVQSSEDVPLLRDNLSVVEHRQDERVKEDSLMILTITKSGQPAERQSFDCTPSDHTHLDHTSLSDNSEVSSSSSSTTPPHEIINSGCGTIRERKQVSDSDHTQ